MHYYFWYLVIVFFCYSVIGYIIEVTSCTINFKKLTLSRGYLIGPYIPIFGFGALGMIYFLQKYQNNVLELFTNSMVICCLLEYFTSLLLEKIFKLRWWDYSDRKFNIDGRVCLENGVLFGIGGVIIVKYFNPLLKIFLYSFSNIVIYTFGIIFLVIILSDTILSTFIISKLKIDTGKIAKDSTEIIRNEIIKSLERYQFFYKRLFKAFPNVLRANSMLKIKKNFEEQIKSIIK